MGKSTRSMGKWFDSLLWLGIAGALAALLVPAGSEQVVCKTATKNSGGLAANVDVTSTPGDTSPSPYYPMDGGDLQYSLPGNEFILHDEADHLAEPVVESAAAPVKGPLLAPPR